MSSVPTGRAPFLGGRGRIDAGTVDVLVVGGGITGASIAWHVAARGLSVALVERGDFGGGATANCLKIVHGGLRYLQHLDLRRMRQSIRERSAWLRSAPHLVEPLPVVMPTFRGSFPPRALLAGALAVNEAVSWDRNHGLPADRKLPRARILSRRQCVALVPELDVPGLTGGIQFHDAIMYSPERLGLEVAGAAAAAGASVVNHMAMVGLLVRHGRVVGARLRDQLSGEQMEVGARWVVNATGSSAPALAASLLGGRATQRQHYSVALNLVTRRPAPAVAYTISAGAADPDRVVPSGRRQLFVVPWRGQTLVGTAHLPYSGDPAAFELEERDVERFLQEVASATPALGLDSADIAVVHRGLLPVADGATGEAMRLLKRHRVLDHATDAAAGLLSVVSVKYTTAHVIGREVAGRITDGAAPAGKSNGGAAGAAGPRLPGAAGPRLPGVAGPRLPGAAFESLDALRRDVRQRWSHLLDDDVLEHLVRSYGSRCVHLLEGAGGAGWSERLVPNAPVIRAQLDYGVEAEMACTVDDLVWRRTEVGPRGLADEFVQRAAAEALRARTRLQVPRDRS